MPSNHAPTSTGPRWGVIGGTFDPVHLGHLLIAESARDYHGLERVLFLLTPISPHKTALTPTPYETRQRLIEAALSERNDDAFQVCTIEQEREGPYYTADTLPLIRARYPNVAQWYFLLGGDAAMHLAHWHEPHRLLDQMRLAILPRPGADLAALAESLHASAAFTNEQVEQILADAVPDAPFIGISSTQVRRRAAEGRSLRYLVPEPVRAILEAETIYTVE